MHLLRFVQREPISADPGLCACWPPGLGLLIFTQHTLLIFTQQMCHPEHRLVQIAESLCKQAQQVLLCLNITALGSGHWAAAP